MLSKRKLCWFSLAVALVAAALLVVGCGESEKEPNTPGAQATAKGTPIGQGDTMGVTDTEIKLGTHVPLSQNAAAAYAPIAYGMKAFFDYINLQGGVYGRKITFLIGDDHYNPSDTVEVVKKLVEQDKVFAIVGGLGEATHNTVWKYLEEKGVPDMYVATGTAKWTDPAVRTRFSGNPDYVTEGTVLGQYIAKNYNGKKLGLLLQSDEMGQDGEKGLRKGIEGSDVKITSVQQYDVVQSDVTAQTQRLKNDGVDVIAVYAIPPQAASLVKAARETLNWDVPIIVSGINQSDIFVALAGANNAEGVVSCVFGHQAYETELPGIQKYEKIWAKTGTGGPLSNFALYGISIAEAIVWDLEMAGPNLTRGSFLDAAESMCNVYCSTCRGVGPWTTSPTDHRMNETEQINVVKDGKWVTVDDPVSYESTSNCTPATPPAGFEDQPKVGEDAEYVDVP
ncbi:MAG: ABC transporter substrate-binding protein [Dehalococcoidia bacterium]|nr:ABC transporter substrate-binding protein [Dehalococcoidia bacterium]